MVQVISSVDWTEVEEVDPPQKDKTQMSFGSHHTDKQEQSVILLLLELVVEYR